MRKTLILIFVLLGLDQAVAQTAKELDGISKVGYCYGALSKWDLLVPVPPQCNKPNPTTAVCQQAASDARRMDRFIAYLSQRMFNSDAAFKVSESAQQKGETDAESCNKANPGMTEPHCPHIDTCLTMVPPQ
jgi:hypothetical protein